MRVTRLVGRGLLALLGGGCQRSAAETSPFTTAPLMTSAADAGSGSSTGGSGASSGSTGGEQSTGSDGGSESASTTSTTSAGAVSTFDVGAVQDFGPDKPAGCDGKIDFLFVISRYAGMGYFQTQLLDALPKFIDTIEAKFSGFDYHIMVVDGGSAGVGGPYWGSLKCNEMCPMPCSVPEYPCDYTPTVCDQTLGAGTVFPAGSDATNKLCPIDGGHRYLSTGQTDLKATFACVAQVGANSNRAWNGEALTAAMHPSINGPSGCNEGFLRDDALLMVTLISNTYDYDQPPGIGSKGTPETWAAAVLAAKHDDPEAVVMFSILDAQPECHPDDRTCEMVKMFPYSLLENVSADDYGPAFDQATGLIAEACAGFVPPG